MAYADYSYYQDVYKGPVFTENTFEAYAEKASREIDKQLSRPVPHGMGEALKLCCCELAECLYEYDISGANDYISSVSNDGYSATFRSTGRSKARNVKSILSAYLTRPVNLLARWV